MDVICLTTSAGLCRSISRLWMLRKRILSALLPSLVHKCGTKQKLDTSRKNGRRPGAHRISKRSQVLVPSPHGDLRVVMCSTLVGMRTGPFTLRCFSLAPRMRSAHTVEHARVLA